MPGIVGGAFLGDMPELVLLALSLIILVLILVLLLVEILVDKLLEDPVPLGLRGLVRTMSSRSSPTTGLDGVSHGLLGILAVR